MIIAVDFDGTLCIDKYPRIGAPKWDAIHWVRYRKLVHGDTIILWTCRKGKRLTEAVKWCKNHGLTFSYINENAPVVKRRFGGDSRKIYADFYLEDKSLAEVRERRNDFDLIGQIAAPAPQNFTEERPDVKI